MSEQQKPSESNSARGNPVGYGRPPAHTRFKKGESGNPNGRKKGQRNIRTVVDDTLKQRITMREGNRTRSVTKLDAVIVTMVNAALKGDSKAQASLINLLRASGMIGEQPTVNGLKPFTDNDDSLIADFLRRRQSEIQQPTESKGKEQNKEEAKEATSSDRRKNS